MWEELNNSELARLASMINPGAHRGLPRDILIRILEEEEIDLPPRGVDNARDTIFLVMDACWDQVKYSISCPMKLRESRACYQCTDIQVAECSLMNARLIETTKEELDG